MDPKTMIALQVAAGLVVVLCIYMLSLWIIQRDQLVVDVNALRQPRLQVKVMQGYATGHAMSNRVWSTINQDAVNFMSLKRSFNRRGGAQFSYSFWMQLADTTPENVAGKTILLRGDKTMYAWTRQVATDATFQNIEEAATFKDVLVKCPRIRFGPSYDTLVVELNTLADPNVQVNILSDAQPAYDGKFNTAETDPSMRYNALSLTKGKWALYTFSFEDHITVSDFESGIMVRFYLNDTLYHTARLPSALRQNYGDLHLMPTIANSLPSNSIAAKLTAASESTVVNGRVGNLNYFNYALSIADVGELYKSGPPSHPASDMMSGNNSDPLYLSEYNKLDIYNT
jgi:hypothetical protein